MTKIEVKNNYSWLLTDNEDIKELLWKALRVRARNYFHNPRYKMRVWDGYNEFFHKKSGRFLTGLLPEIKLALKHKGVEYEVTDHREPIQFTANSIDSSFLNFGLKPIKELYDYQVDYVNQLIRNWRGLITPPTSSGKTAVMKAIINILPPKTPTLILANKKSLIDQNYEEIRSLGIEHVGRLYGDAKEPNYITCATSQSAHLLKPVLPKIKVLIVDEVHEMMSKVPKKIYNALDNCVVRVGMSATAFKFGGTDESQKYEVKGYFGPVLLTDSTEDGKLTTKDLMKRGILSDARCQFFYIHEPQLPYEIYLDAVTKGIAENEHFHDKVVDLVGKLEGRTLILVERIEHGDRLFEKIKGSLWVKGKDNLETRKEIIERLKTDKDVVAIATSGIFNTGINVFVHNLVNGCSGQAAHAILQRIGRGLRVARDKKQLNYYDFIFKINDYLYKHSMQRVKILKGQGYDVEIKEYPG